MKRLLFDISLLTIALAVSIFGVERIYRNYYTPPDSIISNFREIEEPINTVLIGNSHIIALGHPEMFAGKSFNLSFSGITLFDMKLLVENVVIQNPGVKNILLGIDYDILGLNSDKSILSVQLYKYTHALDNNSLGEQIKGRSNYFRTGQDYFYMFSKKDYSYLYTGKSPDVAKQNFIPLTFKGKGDKVACARRAIEHGSLAYDEKNVEKNSRYLKELIAFGKSKGLNLIFVCTPKSPCYLDSYLNLAKTQSAKQQLDLLFKEAGMNYYDLLNDQSFNDDDFIDFDHLNDAGALKFISILQKDIQ
jgi:hypothetical protein